MNANRCCLLIIQSEDCDTNDSFAKENSKHSKDHRYPLIEVNCTYEGV